MKSEINKQARKTYQNPRLLVYGNINVITRTVGNTGNRDGGTGHAHKTQP